MSITMNKNTGKFEFGSVGPKIKNVYYNDQKLDKSPKFKKVYYKGKATRVNVLI
jgi:hypothetical protein